MTSLRVLAILRHRPSAAPASHPLGRIEALFCEDGTLHSVPRVCRLLQEQPGSFHVLSPGGQRTPLVAASREDTPYVRSQPNARASDNLLALPVLGETRFTRSLLLP